MNTAAAQAASHSKAKSRCGSRGCPNQRPAIAAPSGHGASLVRPSLTSIGARSGEKHAFIPKQIKRQSHYPRLERRNTISNPLRRNHRFMNFMPNIRPTLIHRRPVLFVLICFNGFREIRAPNASQSGASGRHPVRNVRLNVRKVHDAVRKVRPNVRKVHVLHRAKTWRPSAGCTLRTRASDSVFAQEQTQSKGGVPCLRGRIKLERISPRRPATTTDRRKFPAP